MLDCFANQGGFSADLRRASAGPPGLDRGGKRRRGALRRLRANAVRNGLRAEVHEENVFDFLKAAERRELKYDLIILDPPSFTKARGKVNDALCAVITSCTFAPRRCSAPGGLLATFSCSHHVSAGEFEGTIASGFSDARCCGADYPAHDAVGRSSGPAAHARNGLPQGAPHRTRARTLSFLSNFKNVARFSLAFSPRRINCNAARFHLMPSDFNKGQDPYLELAEDNPEDLGEEVQKTNTELEKLKRQLEDIEKQKVRLEELAQAPGELDTGRLDMIDKLTRSLVVVQREADETQKRIERLHSIHNSFTQHLRFIESINPKAWGTNELPKELSKALSAVEDARADYAKAQAKIQADSPSEACRSLPSAYADEYEADGQSGFGYWLKNGFAFTLPCRSWAGSVSWFGFGRL